MPLQIVADEKSILGTQIPRKTIIQMVQNFVNRTFKGYRKVTKDNDSHAVYYSKKEIDELFRVNGYNPDSPDASQFGLRVYLAVHGDTAIESAAMPNRPNRYQDQHTVILVATKNKVDLLAEGNFISSYLIDPGTGLEEGEICPPPKCSTIDDELQP